MKPDWTPEQTQWLLNERARGVPYRTLAAEVGRTPKALERRVAYVREQDAA